MIDPQHPCIGCAFTTNEDKESALIGTLSAIVVNGPEMLDALLSGLCLKHMDRYRGMKAVMEKTAKDRSQ